MFTWENIKAKILGLTTQQKIIGVVVLLLLASIVLTSAKTFLYLSAGAGIAFLVWKIYEKYIKKTE